MAPSSCATAAMRSSISSTCAAPRPFPAAATTPAPRSSPAWRLIVSNGGSASGETISTGGTLEIFTGATYSGVSFEAGAILEVGSGNTLSNVIVSSGLVLQVDSGATISGVTVEDGGSAVVLSGGAASGTEILSGGTEYRRHRRQRRQRARSASAARQHQVVGRLGDLDDGQRHRRHPECAGQHFRQHRSRAPATRPCRLAAWRPAPSPRLVLAAPRHLGGLQQRHRSSAAAPSTITTSAPCAARWSSSG